MLRSAAVLLSLLLTLGSLDAKDAEPGNQQAWLRFGTFVTQVYSIPQSGFASTLTFVSQLPDGDLLVGSTNGAYLYDGSRWSQIPDVPMAFSLLKTRRDKILIGSGGTIFELRKGAVGAYEAKHRLDVGGVENRVLSMDEENSGGLLGCIGRGLFYGGAHSRMRVVSPASGTQGIASIKSGVFFAINEHGFHLARLNSAKEPVDVEENFHAQLGGEHVVDIKSKDPSSCWAITSDGRTFSFDGQTLQPAPWHAANPVLRIVPSCIVKLDEGYLVGSLQEGAFIFAGDGSPTTHLNLDNGLPDESVVGATTDRDGGLWIATSKNLVRLDAKLRFRDFGPKQGLKIQDSEVTIRHRGHIYVGGGGGLFVQNFSTAAQNEAFEQVPGLDVVRGLVSDGETLWIGSHRLSAIDSDGSLTGYDTKEIYSVIIPKARKDMVICGTSDGFAILKKAEGAWQVDRLIPAGGLTVWGIGECKPDEYWAMLGTGKAARLRQNNGIWELKIVGAESGLPARWIDLGIIDGRILAPAEMGFMTGTRASEWDEASGRFIPTEDYTYYFGWLGPHIYHPIFYRKNGEAVVMGAFRDCNLVAPHPSLSFRRSRRWPTAESPAPMASLMMGTVQSGLTTLVASCAVPAPLMNLLRRRRAWSFGRYVTSGTGVCSMPMWATEDRCPWIPSTIGSASARHFSNFDQRGLPSSKSGSRGSNPSLVTTRGSRGLGRARAASIGPLHPRGILPTFRVGNSLCTSRDLMAWEFAGRSSSYRWRSEHPGSEPSRQLFAMQLPGCS